MSDLLFTPADLAEMRALSEANLPHSCDVQHGTRTREAGGTYTTNWTVEQNDVPCRLATIGTPAERLSAGSLREIKEFEVVFPYGTWINPERRLVITHDIPDLASPLTLYVSGSPARTSEMQSAVIGTTEGGE